MSSTTLGGSVSFDHSLYVSYSGNAIGEFSIDYTDQYYQEFLEILVSSNNPFGFKLLISSLNKGELMRHVWNGNDWGVAHEREGVMNESSNLNVQLGNRIPYFISFELAENGLGEKLGFQDGNFNEVFPDIVNDNYLYQEGVYPTFGLNNENGLEIEFSENGTTQSDVGIKEATHSKTIKMWIFLNSPSSYLLRGLYKDVISITLY